MADNGEQEKTQTDTAPFEENTSETTDEVKDAGTKVDGEGAQEEAKEQTQPAETDIKQDEQTTELSDNVTAKEESPDTPKDEATSDTTKSEEAKKDQGNADSTTLETAITTAEAGTTEANDNVKTADDKDIILTEDKQEAGATSAVEEEKGSKAKAKKEDTKPKKKVVTGVPVVQPEGDVKTLNLVLFGATGPTGRLILQQALELGHTVTAIVRSPEKLEEVKHENLEVKKGDASDGKTFSEFLAGKDAVLSALGARSGRFANITLYSQTMREIHEAMKSNGITRLVAMSAWGTQDTPDLPFLMRWFVIPVLLKNYMVDLNRMEEYLRTTELNYTVVRPPELLKAPRPDFEVIVVEEGQSVPNSPFKISRHDVAAFMLNALQVDQYDKKMLAVGMRRK